MSNFLPAVKSRGDSMYFCSTWACVVLSINCSSLSASPLTKIPSPVKNPINKKHRHQTLWFIYTCLHANVIHIDYVHTQKEDYVKNTILKITTGLSV